MLKAISTALITLFVSLSWAGSLESEQREFFEEIQYALKAGSPLLSLDAYPECYDKKLSCQTGRELFVQAIDEMLEANSLDPKVAETVLSFELKKDIPLFDFIHILVTFKELLPAIWEANEKDFAKKIQMARASRQMDARSEKYLESHYQSHSRTWSNRYDVAKALLSEDPPIQSYWDGRYHLKPRIFMFCRDNRKQPCLMVLKDATGRLSRYRDGTLWSQQSLGFSRYRKDFHQTNGNTPSGVWRIDGVMPSANKQTVFGKYRRMILNFVGSSPDEANIKKLLPTMTHEHKWWREGVTARNNGRGLFRIHGTGLRSSKRQPYFPMVPTAGCVAKAENTYNKIVYRDQRELLDKLMISSGFDPVYENERLLLGLLYVIDIDKKEEPVTLNSLREEGILN